MTDAVKRIVIVGGGTAGWLTAGLLAAEHRLGPETDFELVLIESPRVPPIGVGEGTWPSMRSTLHKIGLSETTFIRECDASFKQGTCFKGWNNASGSIYYHPFSAPQDFQNTNLALPWQSVREKVSFAEAVSPQPHVCERGLAPKTMATPEYAFNLNYGYHLDAGKFSALLQKHCVEKLGVMHWVDDVTGINSAYNGDIESLATAESGNLTGDLFVDCSGLSSLLIGKHYGIPFVDKQPILFNDRALAVQVPYREGEDQIASATLSTARSAGWIWDIGLPSRRGVGYVYSSAHQDPESAEETLRDYLKTDLGSEADTLSVRPLEFSPGHRETFWYKNCVAIGLSAGFLEPLEASALVLVEMAAKLLSEQMPADRQAMSVVAKRFNQTFHQHWENVIDFLKLHYVLSDRPEPFWRDNRNLDSIPDRLQELLILWRTQPPWHHDTPRLNALFPSASFQYVLYGMGFETRPPVTNRWSNEQNHRKSAALFQENAQRTREHLSKLPTNRELIRKVHEFGFQKI